jgi:drug/metabolite transporter, DME family
MYRAPGARASVPARRSCGRGASGKIPRVSSATSARLRLALAAVLFSTGGAAIKAAAFTSWQIAGFRSGVAAAVLWLLVPSARRGWTWRVILVGATYAATLVLFVLANRLTTAANTIFLQSTAPLYVLFLGPWLLDERVRPVDVGFMAVVGLGLALFFVGAEPPLATAPDPARGNLLAAGSGVTWALTVCGLRWMGARESGGGSGMAAVVVGNLLAFGAALPHALPLGSHRFGAWAMIFYLGAFQIGLAYVLVTSALRHLPALEASVLLLIEPALNPLWAWAVHGEVPGGFALGGGALILGATTLRTWLDARGRPAAAPVGSG